MEVTQANFKATLPEIETAIKNCTFVSIDTELTGLKTSLNKINAFDTPKQYYEKVIKDCRQFLVVQYGLTFFRYDEAADVFKHKSYNFYIFRKPVRNCVTDQRFLCQTSCIDFLIKNGFDFNKLFKDGISYLNNVEEDMYKNSIEETEKRIRESSNKSSGISIPAEHQDFVDSVVKELQDFLASEENEKELPKCNAFLRLLIYQVAKEKFQDQISLETRVVGKDRILFAKKYKSQIERMEIDEKKIEDMQNSMNDYIGFSKVIRMIIESEKLVVGHNVMLDLLHTIHKFVTPLPEDYDDFKECASSLFPKIVDTKHISSSESFKDLVNSTVLAQLLETLQKEPFEMPKIEVEENSLSYNINDAKEHEAGYDSFITGVALLGLWKYLGIEKGSFHNDDIFANLEFLKPYLNKIFLMYLSDNQYAHLSGPDLNPSREHVFYLTFPKEWTPNTIVQLFSPFGGVYIAWLSEASAFVALHKKDQAAVALKTLSQGDTYSIMTFAKRQALLAGLRTIAPSPIKRRKSIEGSLQTKRRKTNSFDGGSFSSSKRSIEPIVEEEQQTDQGASGSPSKRGLFEVASNWD